MKTFAQKTNKQKTDTAVSSTKTNLSRFVLAGVLSCTLLLTGCAAPLLIGGGAAVGVMATREKNVTTTLSDGEISIKIKAKLYSFDKDLHAHVGLNVQNGEALLTGSVPKEEWIIEAERLSWQVRGVKAVHNNLTAMKDPNSISEALGSVPKDSFITTQVKAKLLFEENVRSANFSVKTVDSVVYIMGIARHQAEADHVVKVASKVGGVKKVVNYIEVDPERGGADDDQANSDNATTTPTPIEDGQIDPAPHKS
jgi:osmotically-inducible protein OsmY